MWRWEWTSLRAVAGSLEWMDFFYNREYTLDRNSDIKADKFEEHFKQTAA
ncbi:MAG: hypothetical protein ACSNEK_09825 [Parachlamydiaceae bacterium]